MATLEQAIAAALEPLLDELFALEAQVKAIQLTPGPQGPQGEPGPAIDPDEIARALKHDPDFIKQLHDEGETRETLEIEPENLARTLNASKDLREILRGERGAGIETPQHELGKVYREGSIVSAHIGQYFRAACDTVAAPGDSEDWQRIGCAGFRWRKLKPDEATLKAGDLYIDGGSLFLFSDGRASMLVQRGRQGNAIKSIRIDAAALVCEMDSGKDLRADLTPLFETVTKQFSARLDKAHDTLTELQTRLSILEGRVELLDSLVGGEQ